MRKITTNDRMQIMYFLELLRDLSVIDQPFVVRQIGNMCIEDRHFAGRWFHG